MADKKNKHKPPPSGKEKKKPLKPKKKKPSSTGKWSKIEVDALKAMLKKAKGRSEK